MPRVARLSPLLALALAALACGKPAARVKSLSVCKPDCG